MSERKFVAAYKAGRCFNGAHRDAGRIIHAVEPLPETMSSASQWLTKAACGAKPGQRGYGWSESSEQINCPKCLIKTHSANGIAEREASSQFSIKKTRAGVYEVNIAGNEYTVTNHGYYSPDKCIWWEAVNKKTGEADFHEHTKSEIIKSMKRELLKTE